ncbi:MAG: hypothetical protein M3Y67_10800 [Pseudomonadota bacterium]|nr:hypothetical protein [Pseudomonadota bacterium]
MALCSGLVVTATSIAAPTVGRYEATLCVSHAAQPRSCGPADVDVRAGGSVDVQVSDIVYRLHPTGPQAGVVVTQGAMQIDEFESGADWAGSSLRFADADKQVRYEVQIGAPKRSPK